VARRGFSLSLTTPIARDSDALFPGEGWFFYWKTSASLWRTKMAESRCHRLIVPINWSFHSETGEAHDLAKLRPETDLKRLWEVAKELSIEITFLVPLAPVPFLPNGGIPHLLARHLSQDEHGRVYGIVDPELSLNKLYSFFDTRVFTAFGRFVRVLGRYFSESGIGANVWGYIPGYLDESGFKDYLIDRSPVYDQAFSKFLQARRDEKGAGQEGARLPEDEQRLHRDFLETIRSLYYGEAEKALSPNWEGEVRVAFIGGAPGDFFSRRSRGDSPARYCVDLVRAISFDVLPSSSLLPSSTKTGVVKKAFNDLVQGCIQDELLRPNLFEEGGPGHLAPLVFFEIYEAFGMRSWNEIGLMPFLEKDYRWCYKRRPLDHFKFDETVASHSRVFFFQGRRMDRALFHGILKTFMAGGRILLDRSGMDLQYLKKLEVFLLENDLRVEKVNLATTVHNVTLGDGRLLVFQGDGLTNQSFEVQQEFWEKIIGTFDLQHLKMNCPEGVEIFWRTRTAMSNELKYEEVRRLSLYNPSSYKRRLQLSPPKNFSLLKIIDEQHASVTSRPSEVDIELLPGASLSLDFGVFS
jgi:hypothetical protein